MKKTLTQRIADQERKMRRLQKELGRIERELEDRTRPTSRIGFEAFWESDWDIGDARPKNVNKSVWRP